jgi:hypothetical protein
LQNSSSSDKVPKNHLISLDINKIERRFPKIDDKKFWIPAQSFAALVACQSLLFRFLIADEIIKKDELIFALDSLIEKFGKEDPNNNITTHIKILKTDISNATLRKDSDWLKRLIEEAGKNMMPS